MDPITLKQQEDMTPIEGFKPELNIKPSSEAVEFQESIRDAVVYTGTSVEDQLNRREEGRGNEDLAEDVTVSTDIEQMVTEALAEQIMLSEDDSIDTRFLKKEIDKGNLEVLRGTTKMAINLMEVDRQNINAIDEVNRGGRGLVEKIIDGVDYYLLRGLTIGIYEQLTKETQAFGREVLQKASSLSPTEFKEWYKGQVDTAKSQGFFTSENLNALEQRAATSTNAGIDPDADVNQALAGLDIATGVLPLIAFKAVKKILTSKGYLQRAATDPKLARKVAEVTVSENPSGRAIVGAGPSSFDPDATSATKVSAGYLTRNLQENAVARNFMEDFRGAISEGELAVMVSKRVAQFSEKLNNKVVDYRAYQRAPQVYATELTIGTTKDSSPFASVKSAQRSLENARKQYPNAEVTLEPVEEGLKQQYIKVRQDVSLLEVTTGDISVPETDPFTNLFGRVFGSGAFNGDSRTGTISSFNEGVLARKINEVENLFDKTVKSLNNVEAKAVYDLQERLWNGVDAGRKTWYSEDEFNSLYRSYTNGQTPTKKAYDAFNTFRDISDTAAILTAIPTLNKRVSQGYVRLVADNWGDKLVGKAVKNVPDGEKVIDLRQIPNSGEKIVLASKKRLKETEVYYQLSEPVSYGDGTVKYAMMPDKVKLLTLDDVMGHNAGPHRSNIDARYFVTTGENGRKAILTAFSKTDAEQAKKEISTLKQALDDDTLDEDLIAGNNAWNRDIQTVDDFKEFVEKVGLEKSISLKKRDGKVEDQDLTMYFGDTWGTYFDDKRHRGEVLMEFGGERTHNVSPTRAIAEQFDRSAFGFAFNSATTRDKVAFHRLVLTPDGKGLDGTVVELKKGISEADAVRRGLLEDPDLLWNSVEIVGNGRRQDRLRAFKQSIENRMNIRTNFDHWLDERAHSAAEYVFDKTKGTKFEWRIRGDFEDVQDNLLGYAFQSVMGLFNPSQLLMQGFQAATIFAIRPRLGLKASGMYFPVAAMADVWQHPKMVEQIMKNTAIYNDPETLFQAAKYIRISGRDLVPATAAEKGVPVSFGLRDMGTKGFVREGLDQTKSGAKRLLDAGLYFFRKGEQVSRKFAIITAHLEAEELMKKKGSDLFGKGWDHDDVKHFITKEEQKLTFHMNNQNRSTIQKGAFRLPGQWSAYMLRVFESVATGRHFTKAERGRLFMFLGPLMGLSYMGGDSAVDYLVDSFGGDPSDEVYDALRYGVVDGVLRELGLGEEISVGSRLSYARGVTDMIDHFGEATIVEALAGPAGEITAKTAGGIFEAAGHLANGRETLFLEETFNTLRNIKSFDNAALAAGVLKHGQVRNRNGVLYDWEMTNADAVAFALGFRPDTYNEILEAKRFLFYNDQEFRKKSKEYGNDLQKAMDLATSEDPKEALRGGQMLKELNDMLNLDSRLSSQQREEIRRKMKRQQQSMYKLVERLVEAGQEERARRLMKRLQGE